MQTNVIKITLLATSIALLGGCATVTLKKPRTAGLFLWLIRGQVSPAGREQGVKPLHTIRDHHHRVQAFHCATRSR